MRAQTDVAGIAIAAEPAAGVVRPLETAVLQALVYGKEHKRLQPGGVAFRLADAGGGWLSRLFAHPGSENAHFARSAASPFRLDLSSFTPGDMPALRDSVLYTAPQRPGRYRIEAAMEGRTAAIEIRVEADAPPRRQPEQTAFPPERHADPRLPLAAHYAPVVAQETWFDPKADYLARFDFDGNWRGDDNWEHTGSGSSQAYVYYAVMETSTHWFLIYNFFHPRDYAERCFAGTCHENDNEGMILTVRKDGTRFGSPQLAETLAHDRIYSYRADPRVQNGLHRIAGPVEWFEGSHPVVCVESGGHGVYGLNDGHCRYSLASDEFAGGTGVTYVYGGEAGRPLYANDRRVAYDLLPIYEHWWLRAVDAQGGGAAFDDECSYQPLGGRPAAAYAKIPCSFLGRAQARNRARPFWGWFEPAAKAVLARGQWGLDPAWAVRQTLRLPEPFALDYVFNPFLQPR